MDEVPEGSGTSSRQSPQVIAATVWERRLHQQGSLATVAVTADRVVLHERGTRLVCLDRRDGSVRWDVPVGTYPRAVVAAGDRCLVLPQDKDGLFCFDLETGAVVWQAGLRPFSGHVVVTGETVVVGGWREYSPVGAFDLADGRLLWRTPRRVATERPLAWGGAVLLGSGPEVWLVDPRDGRELTRLRLPEPLTTMDSGPAFVRAGSDRCLVRCGPRSVVCVRPGAGQAERIYEHDADLMPWPPQLAGGVVWLGTWGGGYLAVDPGSRARWEVDAGQPFASGVVRDGEGFVLAGLGGVLFRLAADGRIIERSWSSATRVYGLRDLGAGEMLTAAKGTLRLLVSPSRAAGRAR